MDYDDYDNEFDEDMEDAWGDDASADDAGWRDDMSERSDNGGFDWEDAFMLGGIMGFAEERAREERVRDPFEHRDHEKKYKDSLFDEAVRSDRQFRMLAAGNPEMAEYVVEKVMEFREKGKLHRKSVKMRQELLRDLESCKKEEKQTGSCSEERRQKTFEKFLEYKWGNIDEEYYEKYPDLFLLEELIGQEDRIEIDYLKDDDKVIRGLAIRPLRLMKHEVYIYVEAFVEQNGSQRYFRVDRIKKIKMMNAEKESNKHEEVTKTKNHHNISRHGEDRGEEKYNLRCEPMRVSDREFRKVMGLDRDWRLQDYVENEYKDNGDGTVTDHATGLMWQKSGSAQMNYKGALEYVEVLNGKGSAGYADWRFPTVEELTSLLEADRQAGGLCLDPLFGSQQKMCWSADRRADHEESFVVLFSEGDNFILPFSFDLKSPVRAVRSVRESKAKPSDPGGEIIYSSLDQKDFDRNSDLYFFEQTIEKGDRIKVDYDSAVQFCHGLVIRPQQLFKFRKSIYLKAFSESEGGTRNYWLNDILNVRRPQEPCAAEGPAGKTAGPHAHKWEPYSKNVGGLKITAFKEPPGELVRIAIEECRGLPTVKEVIFDAFVQKEPESTGVFDPRQGVILVDLGNCITNQMWMNQGMLHIPNVWFNMLWTLFHEIAHALQLRDAPSIMGTEQLMQAIEEAADAFATEKVAEWAGRHDVPGYEEMGWAGIRIKQFFTQTFGIVNPLASQQIEEYEMGLVANVEDIKKRRGENYFSEEFYKELCELIDEGELGICFNNKRYLNAREFFQMKFHVPIISPDTQEASVHGEKKRVGEVQKGTPQASAAKDLAHRIKRELNLEVFPDDVDKYLGGQKVDLLVKLSAEYTEEAEKLLKEVLEGSGYEFTRSNSETKTAVWNKKSGKDMVFIFKSPEEFKQRVEKIEILSNLFRENPDYALIAESLCEGKRWALTRKVFIRLIQCFLNHEPYTVEDGKGTQPPAIAERIKEAFKLDVYVEKTSLCVGRDDVNVNVKLTGRELAGPLDELLRQDGYYTFDFPELKGIWFDAWYKSGAATVQIYYDELAFEKEVACSRWLYRLFKKRPDYAMIGKIIKEVISSKSPRGIFLGLARDPRFHEWSP